VFSVPLFRHVPEPAVAGGATRRRQGAVAAVGEALERLAHTSRDLKRYRQGALMLVAFLIYNDGIGTIFRMATIYGDSIGLKKEAMIAAIVLVQFVGIPAAFGFGTLAGRIGPKPAILLGLVVYAGISVLGYFMTTAAHFFMLAFLVGLVQGGTQALSRSLFASMIPRDRAGEFFGFFGVVEKFAGIFGPFLFALSVRLTGDTRNAILSVIAFFFVGGALLCLVDVEQGRREARQGAGETHGLDAEPSAVTSPASPGPAATG
jgi:UMF1 family MFS transporter